MTTDEPTDGLPPTDGAAPTDTPAPAAAAAATSTSDVSGPAHVEVPDELELERIALPATVRRAPKFGAFIAAGALLGALVGLVLVRLTASPDTVAVDPFAPFLGGDGVVRLLAAVAFAVLGGLVGGALAVLADRRSGARR